MYLSAPCDVGLHFIRLNLPRFDRDWISALLAAKPLAGISSNSQPNEHHLSLIVELFLQCAMPGGTK
jgi:hypothetical protein